LRKSVERHRDFESFRSRGGYRIRQLGRTRFRKRGVQLFEFIVDYGISISEKLTVNLDGFLPRREVFAGQGCRRWLFEASLVKKALMEINPQVALQDVATDFRGRLRTGPLSRRTKVNVKRHARTDCDQHDQFVRPFVDNPDKFGWLF
jgi:hypothetical protein